MEELDELKKLTRIQLYEILMAKMRKVFGDTRMSHKGKGELMHHIIVLDKCIDVAFETPKVVCPRGVHAKTPGVSEVKTEDCVVRVPHLKTNHSINVEDGGKEKYLYSRTKGVL